MSKGKIQLNSIDVIVGANLRMMRIARRISQKTLGDEVGVAFQQIQKYERGSNRIGASRLWQMCKFFDCEPGSFFIGIDQNTISINAESDSRTDLYQHPRGPALAKAFLGIKNKDLENQIIAMCRTLIKKEH